MEKMKMLMVSISLTLGILGALIILIPPVNHTSDVVLNESGDVSLNLSEYVAMNNNLGVALMSCNSELAKKVAVIKHPYPTMVLIDYGEVFGEGECILSGRLEGVPMYLCRTESELMNMSDSNG